jgi:hypothetical protein
MSVNGPYSRPLARISAEDITPFTASVRQEWVAKYAKDFDSQALFDFTVALFAE